jgi:hypothetical protein
VQSPFQSAMCVFVADDYRIEHALSSQGKQTKNVTLLLGVLGGSPMLFLKETSGKKVHVLKKNPSKGQRQKKGFLFEEFCAFGLNKVREGLQAR